MLSLSDYQQLSPQQRFEIRNSLRNLDSFLAFPFSKRKRLSLIDRKVHGYTVKKLQETDLFQLPWKDYPHFWWNKTLDLPNVCKYMTEYAPRWAKILKNDTERLILLERQCALLEKAVSKYNEKRKSKEQPLHFVNPLRKTLQLQLIYPEEIGKDKSASTSYRISFDRLTSHAELSQLVNEALKKPVSIRIKASTEWNNRVMTTYTVSAVPEHLFKKVVQQPETVFDPSDQQLRPDVVQMTVAYEDHDWNSLGVHLFVLGQNDSLPKVYQQGFSDGKVAGYCEAVERIKTLFSR